MDFDFIQKLSDDITTVRVFEFPAEHSEPETHGLIEDLNENQPVGEVWKRGQIDVVPKRHLGVAAFEVFPICLDTGELRFQLPG